MEEKKPVVIGEKAGRVWKSKNFWDVVSFRNFVLAGHGCNEQNQRFFSCLLLYKCFLEWVHDGGIQICSGWAIPVRKRSELNKSSTSCKFRTVKTLMQGTQFESSLVKNLSKSGFFSMPTLIEEIKPVFLVNYEFGFGEEKMKMFSSEVLDDQDIDGREKQRQFNWILGCNCSVFDWDFDGGNRTAGGSKVKNWWSSETKMKSTFWFFWNITNPMHGSN